MAELIQSTPASGKHSRRRNIAARPDMTPMVDLAFLLVTFFVLTTSMMKSRAMEIIYPSEEGVPLKANNVVSILLDEGKNRIFWYYGEFKGNETEIHRTDLSSRGLRKIILEYNRSVNERILALESQFPQRNFWTGADHQKFNQLSGDIYAADHALTVLIKTLPATQFSEVISAMDELNICNVRKRAVQDMNSEEAILIKGL
ncbi:MAG: ExbD/TolR family protein [Flavobacteriales bacterium]